MFHKRGEDDDDEDDDDDDEDDLSDLPDFPDLAEDGATIGGDLNQVDGLEELRGDNMQINHDRGVGEGGGGGGAAGGASGGSGGPPVAHPITAGSVDESSSVTKKSKL